jgi:enoyl-CoA hydratase/carnithine racemase
MTRQLTAAQDAAVLTVTIDNPPFNFLTASIVAELEAVLIRAERDPSVRAVVLAGGVPGVFIGHYDVDEILAGASKVGLRVSPVQATVSLAVVAALVRIPGVSHRLDGGLMAGIAAILRFHRVIHRLLTGSTVIVSAMGGSALGGGFELAAASDVRIMADGDYELGLMESTLGLIPGGAGTQLLTRCLGTSSALETLLEGRLLRPRAALQMGLVHALTDPDDVLAEAHLRAHRLALRPSRVVRAVKRAVHDGSTRKLTTALARERADFLSLASGPAAQDALREYSAGLRRHRDARSGGHPLSETPARQNGIIRDIR